MVKYFKWLMIGLLPSLLQAQESVHLNLEQVYNEARNNYPAIRQKDLVKKTAELNIDNLSKAYLPQLQFNGQASYQSDVTKINIPLPGITVPSLSKDQYKITADISQTIYDGGTIRAQKEWQQLNAGVEDGKAEVELYQLKERINQLYLGVLYLDEQLKQSELVRNDLNNGIRTVNVQVNNGVAFRSNLNLLKAELLKADQRVIELNASRRGMINTLGLFLNRALSENIVFEKPPEPVTMDAQIARPELNLYSNQSKLFAQQDKLIDSKNLPKFSAFLQGGYGRPGLNFLDNSFDLFYVAGVRLNWSLGGLYTKKKEKELVRISQQQVDVQKETFLLNANARLIQEQSDIDKLQKLVATDREIIDLRRSVKDAAKAQLDNGVITASNYLDEVNAEDQARQSMITHQLQLLQAKINYQTISGKQ
ncbi:MAG: transporter [Citrobacter freundii]|nr:MAG: transporter [Citrobacter freundii]